MEDIFSSKSSEIIEKKLQVDSNNNRVDLSSDAELDRHFDVALTAQWVAENSYKRVALQFPDELLYCAIRVMSRLRASSGREVQYFMLADTSYGSCCVDLVAAEHNSADALVHYGHSCLSQVDKLPVFYVFEKLKLDLDLVAAQAGQLLGKSNLIILYDVAYSHLYAALKEKFSVEPRVFVSRVRSNEAGESQCKVLFSRELPADLTNETSDRYSFLYIGNRDSFLNPFLFYFNKLKFHRYDPGSQLAEELPFSKTNRELMKRFYFIEKAKDANIFGILIGTMSVAKYKEAIDHVSSLLKKANKRYYMFLIGKLNCPKLNNFMEVDMYVMISCNENCLINSKELNKPIVTVYELEIAYNSARLWGNEYICDYQQLLEGSEHHVPAEVSTDESDVSLITGSMRHTSAGVERAQVASSLISRNEALSVLHYAGAGEYLQNRSWRGLEQNLGQTEVTKAAEGQRGIAATYVSEPELKNPDNH